jgi:hypothetical protein
MDIALACEIQTALAPVHRPCFILLSGIFCFIPRINRTLVWTLALLLIIITDRPELINRRLLRVLQLLREPA